jgi:RNA polymerase sigma-70 factor (ECF subfamily)
MQTDTDPWEAAAIDQNRQWLLAYLLSLTGDPGAVDDLVQEVFVIALRKRNHFVAGTNFGGWLRTIARNVAMTYGKRRRRELLVSDVPAMEALDRVATATAIKDCDPNYADALANLMRKCLGKLTERVRRLFELRYCEHKSTLEVAKEVKQSEAAINVAIFRGRLALTECMKRHEAAI